MDDHQLSEAQLRENLEFLAKDLWAYGEDDCAAWAREGDLLRYQEIEAAQWCFIEHAPGSTRGSIRIDKAFALAAVYVMEGRPRALSRKRRRPLPDDDSDLMMDLRGVPREVHDRVVTDQLIAFARAGEF